MLQAVVAGRQRGRGGRPLRREHGAVVVGERVNDAHGGEVWADLGGEMVASPVEKEGCCGGGAVGEGGGEKTPFSLLALEGREGGRASASARLPVALCPACQNGQQRRVGQKLSFFSLLRNGREDEALNSQPVRILIKKCLLFTRFTGWLYVHTNTIQSRVSFTTRNCRNTVPILCSILLFEK